MVQRTSDYLQAVRHILLNRLQRYDVKIYLFGSMARGEIRKASDRPLHHMTRQRAHALPRQKRIKTGASSKSPLEMIGQAGLKLKIS